MDYPTKNEIIAREVDKLIECAFEESRDFDDRKIFRKEEARKIAFTFKTKVEVFGEEFYDFEDAKHYARKEAIEALTVLAENPPVMFFEYDEGITPHFEGGWPGVKYPTPKTWEKILYTLKRKYGETTKEAVKYFVLKEGNTIAYGVPFGFVLDINYNPKKEEIA